MFISDALSDGAMNETELRRWARQHYVPLADRSLSWPGFILDEMRRQDEELAPVCELRVDGAQPSYGAPKLLLRVATVPRAK